MGDEQDQSGLAVRCFHLASKPFFARELHFCLSLPAEPITLPNQNLGPGKLMLLAYACLAIGATAGFLLAAIFFVSKEEGQD